VDAERRPPQVTGTVSTVPALRLRSLNAAPRRDDGAYVLYWMTAYRRTTYNFALAHAVEQARALGKPLVVLEALRVGYEWASDRLHAFVIEGMRETERACEAAGALYYPYVEPRAGAGSGLLEALAERACAVVGDDFPCFFLPRMQAAVAARLGVAFEVVDDNGTLPLRAAGKAFGRAFDFRRFVHHHFHEHVHELELAAAPFARAKLASPPKLPKAITERWPRATDAALDDVHAFVKGLPVDHGVRPGRSRGGGAAAEQALDRFLKRRLARYSEERNEPSAEVTSELSPYLHFGMLSARRAFLELARREKWTPAGLRQEGKGQREGWWGMSTDAEAFLDQLVTWRELGYNCCVFEPRYDRWESLPAWARSSLDQHRRDARPHLYTLAELEAADTHDELWNAAQRELVSTGHMHNYLRMLWAKKVLEWSPSPEQALEWLVHLNNKYALDGRNPNSYSGIFWCFGRYDRPWAPERKIFGVIRYMSSDNTRRKLDVKAYLAQWSGQQRMF
jgi:deoxyribodipyrimidine photo-lyase